MSQSPAPFDGNAYRSSTPQQNVFNAPAPFVHDTLDSDLERLVVTTRNEFAANLYDVGVQQKLKALLDLQTILSSQQLPPDQRQLIKNQVTQLSQAAQASADSQAQQLFPGSSFGVRSSTPQPISHAAFPQSYQPPSSVQPAMATPSLAQLLAIGPPPPLPPQQSQPAIQPPSSINLAELLAGARPPAPTPQSMLPVTQQENSLFASLRAAGLINAAGAPPVHPPASAAQTQQHLPFLPPLLQNLQPPPAPVAALTEISFAQGKNNVALTAGSIKT